MENFLAAKCCNDLAENDPGRVGLDSLDQLPFASMPEQILGDARATTIASINAMVVEGPRGLAVQRLIAREIQLARAELRFAEAIFNTEATKFIRRNDNMRRLETAVRLLAVQHRRLLSDLDLFARLGGGAPTRISVSARNAVVAVGSPT